jgi:predicted permease
MIKIAEGFLIILIIILSGFFLAKSKKLPADTGRILNRFAFLLAYPCLLFNIISKKDVGAIFGPHMLIDASAAVSIGLVLFFINKKFFKLDIPEALIASLGGVYLNSNNIGLPIATYLLGDPAAVAPILIFQVVILSPCVLFILDIFKSHEDPNYVSPKRKREKLLKIIKTPFTNPLTIGSFAGVFVSIMSTHNIKIVPGFIDNTTEIIGGAAIPCVLIAYGYSLYGGKFFVKGTGVRVTITSTIAKLIVMPIVTFLIAHYAFGISLDNIYPYLALAALPTAQNVFTFSSNYNILKTTTRDTVLLTTILTPFVILIIALICGIY